MKNQKLVTLLTEEEIKASITKIGSELGKAFEGQQLTIVADMSSSFVFVADLIRELPIDATFQFLITPNENKDSFLELSGKKSLENKNVLIVNEVLNKGFKLKRLYELVEKEKPASIQVLNLVEKNVKDREFDVDMTSLFKLEDVFLVGYGLTYKESYRGLKGIYGLTIEQ